MIILKIIKKVLIAIVIFFLAISLFSCGLKIAVNDGPTVKVSGPDQLKVGDKELYTAVVTPSDKFSQNVTWDISNNNLAEISENGEVTGLKSGRITVRATYKDDQYIVVGRFSVLIISDEEKYTDEVPTSIVASLDLTGYIHTKDIIRVETEPVLASHDFLYESSNTEIATVDSFGIVTYNNTGTVSFTVKAKENENVYSVVTVSIIEDTRPSDFEDATVACIEKVSKSVIGVANYVANDRDVLEKKSLGSGFIYDVWGIKEDGTTTLDLTDEAIDRFGYYAITNRHVVKDNDAIKVYMFDIDDEVPATLIQYDDKVDIAVIVFEYFEYIEPLIFADSDAIKSGQTVIAIGNPEGFDYSRSATSGIVSYPLRYVSDDTDGDNVKDWDAAYIQHDAPINPGNSGGPLFNLFGQVVGVNTMKFASTDIDNMGFSIPSNEVLGLIPYLEEGKVPQRARIGVTVIAIRDLLSVDYTQNKEYEYKIPDGVQTGIYVTEVVSGSVADGKIEKDDIILEFNGVQLRNSLQLRAQLNAIVVGTNTEIEVKLLRNGELLTVYLVW